MPPPLRLSERCFDQIGRKEEVSQFPGLDLRVSHERSGQMDCWKQLGERRTREQIAARPRRIGERGSCNLYSKYICAWEDWSVGSSQGHSIPKGSVARCHGFQGWQQVRSGAPLVARQEEASMGASLVQPRRWVLSSRKRESNLKRTDIRRFMWNNGIRSAKTRSGGPRRISARCNGESSGRPREQVRGVAAFPSVSCCRGLAKVPPWS
ncbi:hypothetical protein BD309DRAFT_953458 [Dichomitus squalens]|uniref:Uncharacterized protein n=1 Tax=Dichomitus squalens TaxID=114155 RepID=A0A4Q9P3Y1_9APHY|nr:hypothetical protein BD311DRAFT_747549 [Dichomitus squalens]TBU46706.1 hypothetical protein BD309DRAFT_953458 [Dichomitus squalens]